MGHGRHIDDPDGEPPDKGNSRPEAASGDTHPEQRAGDGVGDHAGDDVGDHVDDHNDDHPDDEITRGAPPNPLDRMWLHPTELSALTSGAGAEPRRARTTSRPRSWAAPVLAGAVGALATVAVLAIAGTFDRGSDHSAASIAPLGVANPSPSVQDAAAHAGLSVVAVAARDGAGTRRGSGVCVRHEGELLTSARLVGNAKTVDVLTNDGRRHTARVLGRDTTTDLALLELPEDGDVPAAQLADKAPSAGSPVWIVGAPAPGTTSLWMSGGLVGSNDALAAVPGGPMTGRLLETDASSGSTATGGALVDRNGSVVGIVIGRVDTSGTSYAVPIGGAVAVAEELRDSGVANHGWAGFTGSDGTNGPTIATVTAGGPAWKAGIRAGDVVQAVDGRSVESMNDVVALVRSEDPGTKLTITVQRGRNAPLDMTVALAAGKS